MAKNYTIKQAAELLNINHRALAKQLERDKQRRKYPHTFKTECCGGGIIPARDLKLKDND